MKEILIAVIPIVNAIIVRIAYRFIDLPFEWLKERLKKGKYLNEKVFDKTQLELIRHDRKILSVIWALFCLLLSLLVFIITLKFGENRPNIVAHWTTFSRDGDPEVWIQAKVKDYSPYYFLVFVQTNAEPNKLQSIRFSDENFDSYWLVGNPLSTYPNRSLGFKRSEILNVFLCVSKGKKGEPPPYIPISDSMKPIDRLAQDYGQGQVIEVLYF